MKKEKSFPVLSLAILAVFGLLCFLGGVLTSNIANKRKVGAIQARLSECENKFFLFSSQVIGNTEAAVKISEGVSSVWHDSVKRGRDFNDNMEKFLIENKDSIADMKLKNDLIDIQIAELEKYKKESQDTFDVVMELYDVYKKLYALGMNPIGTLEGFDSNRQTLAADYAQAQMKLFAYMPGLKNKLSEADSAGAAAPAQAKAQDRESPPAKAPLVDTIRSFVSDPVKQLSFDQRIKKVAKNMTYREVESMAGVPRDKTKDSQGREVWIYPSEKAGFRNVVYFASGKVFRTKNLPLNGNLD